MATYNAYCYFPDNVLPANITFNPAVTQAGRNFETIISDNADVTIEVIANSNYYFARQPSVQLQDASTFSVDITSQSLNEDSTIFNFTFHNGSQSYGENVENIRYTAIEVVEKPPTPTGLSQFITYYKVNDAILNELSQVIIYKQSSDIGVSVVDLTQYISSLRSYPFTIDSSSAIDIILGYSNTGVKAPIANEIYHEIDFGIITLEPTNNDVNDYNATIKALLPYIGYVALDANFYAGQSVNLRYNVDLRTGLFAATFYINDLPVDIFTGKIGQDLPYRVAANDTVSNLIDTSIQDNYPLNATILTVYRQDYNDNSICNDSKTVSTISQLIGIGHCTFDNITLQGVLPDSVSRELLQLLSDDVIL